MKWLWQTGSNYWITAYVTAATFCCSVCSVPVSVGARWLSYRQRVWHKLSSLSLSLFLFLSPLSFSLSLAPAPFSSFPFPLLRSHSLPPSPFSPLFSPSLSPSVPSFSLPSLFSPLSLPPSYLLPSLSLPSSNLPPPSLSVAKSKLRSCSIISFWERTVSSYNIVIVCELKCFQWR